MAKPPPIVVDCTSVTGFLSHPITCTENLITGEEQRVLRDIKSKINLPYYKTLTVNIATAAGNFIGRLFAFTEFLPVSPDIGAGLITSIAAAFAHYYIQDDLTWNLSPRIFAVGFISLLLNFAFSMLIGNNQFIIASITSYILYELMEYFY